MSTRNWFDIEKVNWEDYIPSETFCPYPWKHSYQGCQYERKLCCISDDISGHQKMPTKEFWNSDYMKDVRLKMLKGEKVKECQACYRNERLGIKSLRQTSNEDSIKYGNPKEQVEKLLEGTSEDGSFAKKPSYYDYRTIHCNLQCVSCGTIFSSTHINLANEMWGIKGGFKPDYKYEEDMANEIIEGLDAKRVDNIYWAGGEPFMQPLHWKVIEHMVSLLDKPGYEKYVRNIKMHYNTNLTKNVWKGKKITKILEPFQPSLQPSLDGVYETLEYTRDGAKWNDIDKHWKEYIEILDKNKQMGVATVLSAPVLFDVERYLNYYGPYDPHLHPHYMNVALDQIRKNPGLLDIRWYPEDIFYPTIEKVQRLMKESGLRGSERWIEVCDAYKQEYKELDMPNRDEDLRWLKGFQMYREQFLVTKRTLAELYDLTNPQAADWIRSIKPRFTSNTGIKNRLHHEFKIPLIELGDD